MSDVLNAEKFKIALISTYPEMAKVCQRIALAEGLCFENHFAAFEEAVVVAKRIEAGVDAILSRGGSGECIGRAVNIPIVQIPITPFDVARAIHRVPDVISEVAFFSFRRNIFGIRDIENMYRKTIREYTFSNEDEIARGIEDVKSRGIKIIIGGVVAVKLAQQVNIAAIEISSGEEAVYQAIHEAIHVSQVKKKESQAATRLKVVFDSIVEGVVVSDEKNKVVVFNPAAERIFRLPHSQAIGENIQNIIPQTQKSQTLENIKLDNTCLQKIHGSIIATNRMPICLEGKPIGVVCTFEDVTKIQRLEQAIRKQIYTKGFVAKYRFADIITENPRMVELKKLAALFASTDSSVLIQGESGTGKEFFAQSIHNASTRSSGPFVAVNCAAIPEHLLESELFGYEQGAFTGARKEGKQGLFELAHKGTIFLDEIGEIPRSLQARLLRVLQEREILKVGGDKIVPVDIRIISATNKDIEKKIMLSEFRDDLYYRLNVFNLKIPPLRERKDDIPLLVKKFLNDFNVSLDLEQPVQEMKLLAAYDWPGNVRELSNTVERLALLVRTNQNKTSWLDMLHLVLPVLKTENEGLLVRVSLDKGLKETVREVENAIINSLLAKNGNDRDSVARLLGVSRATVWRKAPINPLAKPL